MSQQIVFGRRADGSVLSFPVAELLERHSAIQGATGQRKTLFLLSFLTQFLADPTHSVVYVDLGGDQAAYWILENACRNLGIRMQLFTLSRFHRSTFFDPLVNTRAFAEDTTIAAANVASGLSLSHSEGYGRNFWGRLNTASINEGFDWLATHGAVGRPHSLAELGAALRAIQRRNRQRTDSSEAVYAVDQILRYPTIGIAPNPQEQHSIGETIEYGGVSYFFLPTAIYGSTARAVGTFAAHTTMVEAADRLEQGKEPRVVHLAVDEFSQIASGRSNVEGQVTLSRKWGVQMHLVFQSREQMKTPDGDLGPILRDNCQRFLFTVASEDEQKELMACSEDEVKYLAQPQTSAFVPTTPLRSYLAPKLERNDILGINAKAMSAYAVLSLGDRHRDPIPFEVIPPTKSAAEHSALKRKRLPRRLFPLPLRVPGQVISGVATARANSSIANAAPGKHQAALALLWQSKHLAVTTK